MPKKIWILVLLLLALLGVGAALAVQTGRSSVIGDCVGPPPSGSFQAFQLRAVDGNCLQAYAWLPQGRPITGVVVMVHGLHDHARRYALLAEALNQAGLAAYALDLRGHAASGGARQRLDSMDQVTGDMALLVGHVRQQHPALPWFVYGHSMGGLVVASFTATRPESLAGAVISSAALKLPPSASAATLKVVAALSALAPGLPLEAVDEAQVVLDPEARAAMAADPLLSREKLPARTAATLLDGVQRLQARMAQIDVPLLILHGRADTVTEVEGSVELSRRAASADKTLKLYPDVRHDLLHERIGAEVRSDIVAFVSARLRSAR